MRSSSLVQIITADALRASIRAAGLLGEVRPSAVSVPRGLVAANAATGLARELERLQGLGDLLRPVSTTREVTERDNRLRELGDMLPDSPGLREAAVRLRQDSGQPALSQKERGELLAAEELGLQAREKRLQRSSAGAVRSAAETLRRALALVHAESASWRSVEDSWLTNRLIADRGFADTWTEARKRARALVKSRTKGGAARFKLSQLREFSRWQQSVGVQLQVLAARQDLEGELAQLRSSVAEVEVELARLILLTRLRLAGRTVKQFDDVLRETADGLAGRLQRAYGVGKSNFRALIESELA